MSQKLKAIYEKGILKPLESHQLPENQILNLTIDWDIEEAAPNNQQSHIIQLQGILTDHPLGDITSDLKTMRRQAFEHIEAESDNG